MKVRWPAYPRNRLSLSLCTMPDSLYLVVIESSVAVYSRNRKIKGILLLFRSLRILSRDLFLAYLPTILVKELPTT